MAGTLTLAGALGSGWCFLPEGTGLLFPLFLVPLFLAADQAPSPRHAFLRGWLFGFVAWGVGLHWVYPTIERFASLPRAAALGFYLGLSAWHGLFLGLWAAWTRALAPALARLLGGREDAALLLASVPLFVWGQTRFPALFPAPLALTQALRLPALQSLEFLGTSGLDLLLALFSAALYTALRSWQRHGSPRLLPLAAAAALLVANEAWGRWRLGVPEAAAEPLTVAVLQGNVPVAAPYDRRRLKIQVYSRLTGEALKEGPVDLVIWPETSYGRSVRYPPAPPELEAALSVEVPHPAPLLLGAVARGAGTDGRTALYNAALLLDARKRFLGMARKEHLMPFGEYIPLGDLFPALYGLSPRTRRFLPGDDAAVPMTEGGVGVGVMICYEDLLPAFARRRVRQGATLLVSMTNDAWFGEGAGPELHLRYSALRAIETRRYLVRAVNSGVSAVIDPAGRVLRRLDEHQRGLIRAQVSAKRGHTPYVRFGDVLGVLCGLAALVAAALAIPWPRARSRSGG